MSCPLNESQPETALRAVTRTPDAKTTVADEQVKCALTSTLTEGIASVAAGPVSSYGVVDRTVLSREPDRTSPIYPLSARRLLIVAVCC